MRYDRGGKSLCVGDIGRFKILRQHLLLPGESLKTTVTGNCRLSGLRQQTSVYLHAQIEAYAAPLRWYFSGFPAYLQEGIKTATTIPTLTGWPAVSAFSASGVGIGQITSDFAKWYAQHPINVWNEWYRWPEDAKISVSTPPQSFFGNVSGSQNGQICVNLPSALTRIHDAPSFDALETDIASATVLDVRDIARYQARFNQAAITDWTSQERYNAFMRDIYKTKGSNEVDQIPVRLQKGANLQVSPRDMYASDGASLGELMSISNFTVNHEWSNFQAQEHMIVCYIMLLRFAPVSESNIAPGAYPATMPYVAMQGDPIAMAGERPVAVTSREVDKGDGTAIGFLPANWQWREGYTHVDALVADKNNFPLLDTQTHTAVGYRDASNINAAFRSTALRHYFTDLDFNCSVQSMVPPAGQSIIAGADSKQRGPKGNHPTGGWLS